MTRSKALLSTAGFTIFFLAAAIAQDGAAPPTRPISIRFNPVARELIEKRLAQAVGENDKRKILLQQMFDQAGCNGERLAEQDVKGTKLPNIICTLPGSTDSVIVVGAHFDASERSLGVIDNWTGAALLPSLYESLSALSRSHTFVFVGFTEEEKGLRGSQFFASQLTPEQKARVKAMVNMDSLALSPTKVWLSRSDKNLAAALNGVSSAMKLPLSAVNADYVGSSDGDSFRSRDIPTVTIHSLTDETLPILHSGRDQLSAADMDEYFASYRLIAGYLAFLDVWLDTVPRVSTNQTTR